MVSWVAQKHWRMIRRSVEMPKELIEEIGKIVHDERYQSLYEAFPVGFSGPLFLSEDEAVALIRLAIIEKQKAVLRFPYYDEDHPNHDPAHADGFDDVQMGIYEKTIYYIESEFKKGLYEALMETLR